ncbi:MAG: site-specific DNA-methyltransferase [Prevotellaceae bacterium]|jgi:DNA modification methylase|nr:site-specific DNA-methyltransferase [Prevotellaceae bacterium]
MEINVIHNIDCISGLKLLPDNSVDCCVTSPPYYALRDYGTDGQIGLETTPEFYVEKLTEVFIQVYRVLKPEGTLWLNIGDSYAGSNKGKGCKLNSNKYLQPTASNVGNVINTCNLAGYKPKDLIGIPFMLAFALRSAGWYLRQDIIWAKPNPMPESVTDRCTKSHEYIFLLSKSRKYYFDAKSIEEIANYDGRFKATRKASKKYSAGDYNLQEKQTMQIREQNRWRSNAEGDFIRNKRDVWFVPTKPLKEEHFAAFPEALIKDCILAGCPENGIVLDCFMGSGTTAIAARKLYRNYIGFELNQKYCKIAENRLKNELGMFL